MIPLPGFETAMPASITLSILDERDRADIIALLRACNDFNLLKILPARTCGRIQQRVLRLYNILQI